MNQPSASGIPGMDQEIAGRVCTVRRGLRQKLWGTARGEGWFGSRRVGSSKGNWPPKQSAQRCRRKRVPERGCVAQCQIMKRSR